MLPIRFGVERVAGASAIIVRNRTKVDAGLIGKAPRLRAVGRLGVGLDNIHLTACKAMCIAVLPAAAPMPRRSRNMSSPPR